MTPTSPHDLLTLADLKEIKVSAYKKEIDISNVPINQSSLDLYVGQATHDDINDLKITATADDPKQAQKLAAWSYARHLLKIGKILPATLTMFGDYIAGEGQ